MPKLTPEKELELRAQIKTDVESVENTGAVFSKPEFFTSKQDFVARCTKQMVNGDDREVQFCQISFFGFEDLPNAGSAVCADDPPVRAIFRLHLFHEYVAKRSDNTNSHDTFTAMILNLRNKFLETQDQGEYTERTPLTPDQFIIFGQENEFFPGAYGHYTNLTVKVELT
jgi:hypothetical protein